MPEFQIEQRVDCASADVWSALTDFSNWSDLFVEMDRVTVLQNKPPEIILQCADVKGHVWREVCQQWVPGKVLSFSVSEDGQHVHRQSTRTWEIRDDNEGAVVTMTHTYQHRVPVVGSWVEKSATGGTPQSRGRVAMDSLVQKARAQKWAYRESVQTILNHKGSGVFSAAPTDTVAALAAIMQEQRIGTVLIVDNSTALLGLVSERDIVYNLAKHGAETLSMLAADIMTRDLIVCEPESDVLFVMACMTDNKVRHLPVIQDGKLSGIVSIGDVVKQRIHTLEAESDTMREYIAARQWRRQSDASAGAETVAGLDP